MTSDDTTINDLRILCRVMPSGPWYESTTTLPKGAQTCVSGGGSPLLVMAPEAHPMVGEMVQRLPEWLPLLLRELDQRADRIRELEP